LVDSQVPPDALAKMKDSVIGVEADTFTPHYVTDPTKRDLVDLLIEEVRRVE
jgi:hypothetical protein